MNFRSAYSRIEAPKTLIRVTHSMGPTSVISIDTPDREQAIVGIQALIGGLTNFEKFLGEETAGGDQSIETYGVKWRRPEKGDFGTFTVPRYAGETFIDVAIKAAQSIHLAEDATITEIRRLP